MGGSSLFARRLIDRHRDGASAALAAGVPFPFSAGVVASSPAGEEASVGPGDDSLRFEARALLREDLVEVPAGGLVLLVCRFPLSFGGCLFHLFSGRIVLNLWSHKPHAMYR